MLIYVNTGKDVGDPDHLKVFASEETAEEWLAENEPEGVAFEHPVIGDRQENVRNNPHRRSHNFRWYSATSRNFNVRESLTGQTRSSRLIYHPRRCWVMNNTSSMVEGPMCPTCKHRMGLARISPGNPGFEDRTFECSTCDRSEKVSFPVDPLKTDALGWLAGELKPPC